jgi:uncharacterized protein YndB with AHSA1/START domain
MEAKPEQVWAVLADPSKYGDWVVGAKEVRFSEGNWPATHARFHHTVGVWPFRLRDETTVLESDRPRRLVLQAKVRPIGLAHIELSLAASPTGTEVTITEGPSAPFVARITRRLFDPAIHIRNSEALRRLEELVRRADT